MLQYLRSTVILESRKGFSMIRGTVSRSIFTFAALLGVVSFAAGSAHAVSNCKAKLFKKTGVIRVSANGITGSVKWGGAAGQETNSFADEGTCVSAGEADDCHLGAPGTPEEIT